MPIKLEDICNEEARLDIFNFLGLPRNIKSEVSLDIEKVNYWKDVITEKNATQIQGYMKKYMDYYKYENL